MYEYSQAGQQAVVAEIEFETARCQAVTGQRREQLARACPPSQREGEDLRCGDCLPKLPIGRGAVDALREE